MSAYLALGVQVKELDDPRMAVMVDGMTIFEVNGKEYLLRILEVVDATGIVEMEPGTYLDLIDELDKELAKYGGPEVRMYLVSLLI